LRFDGLLTAGVEFECRQVLEFFSLHVKNFPPNFQFDGCRDKGDRSVKLTINVHPDREYYQMMQDLSSGLMFIVTFLSASNKYRDSTLKMAKDGFAHAVTK
jgi:hypothetical protein